MAVTQQQGSPTVCRYVGPNNEAFIGPLYSTLRGETCTSWDPAPQLMPSKATLALVKKHCAAISSVPDQQIVIQLTVEGAQPRAQNALFRIVPEVWPAAVSGSLPIVYFSATGRNQQSAVSTMHVELVEEGPAPKTEKPISGMPMTGTNSVAPC